MFKKIIPVLVLPVCLVFLLGVQPAAAAYTTINFGGLPVVFGDPEDCSVFPDVSVKFEITAVPQLEVTLTYNGATDKDSGNNTAITSPNQIFMGVLFDVTDDNVVLTAVSADAPNVVSPGGGPDVSSNYAAKGKREHPNDPDRIVGGVNTGTLGDGFFTNVLGAMGSINALGDGNENNTTLGINDIIAPMDDTQPNGTDFGVVPPVNAFDFVDLDNPNFANDGPYVQNAVTITYEIVTINAATLALNEITNVTPLYGTDGLPLGGDANDCGDPPDPYVPESESTSTDSDGGGTTKTKGGKGKALGHNKNK